MALGRNLSYNQASSAVIGGTARLQAERNTLGLQETFTDPVALTETSVAIATGGTSAALGLAARRTIGKATVSTAANTARTSRTVIGKIDDLKAPGAIRTGENTLSKHLPYQGNPKADWKRNSSVLRQEIRKGNPIRDASVNSKGKLRDNTGFLKAERELLRSKGWIYNPKTQLWSPP